MKASTIAIKNAVSVAYRELGILKYDFDTNQITIEEFTTEVNILSNNVKSLLQKAETPTARELIKRFINRCDKLLDKE